MKAKVHSAKCTFTKHFADLIKAYLWFRRLVILLEAFANKSFYQCNFFWSWRTSFCIICWGSTIEELFIWIKWLHLSTIMCNIAQSFNRSFDRFNSWSVLFSLDVLVEQKLLLFALVFSLTLLWGIGRILTKDASTFSASILIHGRWTCTVGHYLRMNVSCIIVRRWSFTLETVMFALGYLRRMETAVRWRSRNWMGFGHLSSSIGHLLLLKSQLLGWTRLRRTSVYWRSNICNRSRYFATWGCCTAYHIQIFKTAFNWRRLLMRS